MDSELLFDPGTHWYCVRTKPKKERMAATTLAGRNGLEVFCPLIRFKRKTVRGAVWFQEAMFPGYIFVRFDMGEMKRLVSHSIGVMTIPMFGGFYVHVPDDVIESIRQEMDDNGSVDVGVPLKVGDETTVMEGAMRGLKVKVIKVLPAKDRVAVLLEMLGTLVEVEFPVEALEQRSKLET